MLSLLFKSGEPAIINVLSAAASLPVPGASVYNSSKRAALSFTESLLQELAPKGVYVGMVLSGPVKTGLYGLRENKGENRQKVKENIITNVGVSAEREAQRIICDISKRKTRIICGIIAKSMNAAYSKAPVLSVKVAANVMRLLPLKTFKDLLKRDKNKKRGKQL